MTKLQLVQPGHQSREPVLGNCQLGECAAEHHGNAVSPVASELRFEISGRERGSPPELDQIYEIPGGLQNPVDVGERGAVVRNAAPTLLRRDSSNFSKVRKIQDLVCRR